ncbi:MAG: ABC transporter permease [Vicinamibacterales bacterium]|jgi:putative ABC transport system permease protein|nr:hypothetical protein [Acidobacteriota bacterium]MDP6372163.1 ABC transporter permease [Vicinamibacterales bacterium]MDP6607524.1 ABC transporter permease [Vicinamibacterales bacterium]HAK53901.1 hypothetical protein [Acidobacteriota bacterium]|tara:strand:+ start:4603 stop:5799 length:1197 start_codon:yes stop_codon:yes gene_type:complete
MNSFHFAWRSLFRQPVRAALAIAGVAAIGALLFDMLLLSQGMLISFRDLLDDGGFDIRILATPSTPISGPRMADAAATAAAVEALPEVDAVVPMRIGQARIVGPDSVNLSLIGAVTSRRDAWTVVEGVDLDDLIGNDDPPMVINRNIAEELTLAPGGTVTIRSECTERYSVLPTVDFVVSGIAEFPFDPVTQMTAAVAMPDFDRACGSVMDEADVFLVATRAGEYPEMAVAAIQRLRPDLHAYSNDQLVDRFQQVGFSYFRQISTVLATITLFFAFLLISVLLTVSVNQRFAEIAALRALGFSRRRIAGDLLWESILMVGTGGLLALPLGLVLAIWLDRILKAMPGIPSDLHFFVLYPAAVILHVALLAAAGALAAAYPVFLASKLPMASTLRNEVVG